MGQDSKLLKSCMSRFKVDTFVLPQIPFSRNNMNDYPPHSVDVAKSFVMYNILNIYIQLTLLLVKQQNDKKL